ncbi:MAG: ASKHA domain-containing protein [Candidatus Adiutrix sp.]|jgi:uncharacterized 2Fe-2S/4Fe-4S cluster protein (DUF4445 family)|nr:ASKHA domain-containing protein [Candidatus Adiutrix sp.]
MTVFDIVFQPEGKVVPAAAGLSILDVASWAGLHINASCAGAGVCGRCRVEVVSGSVRCETGPGAYFSEEEYGRGMRLACVCHVEGPAEIFIPPESRADASVFAKAEGHEEVTVAEPNPPVRELELALAPPTETDNLGDSDRLLAGLAATHGLEHAELALEALLELPDALRADDFAVRATVYQPVGEPAPPVRVMSVRPARDRRPAYALAVDIGTTSVWARLVNQVTGGYTPSMGDLNGQISFGEDVISRIVFADKGDGLARLQKRVLESLNHLLDRLLTEYEVDRDRIILAVVAGNTTMSHLFAGLSPKNIRLAPYVPAAAGWPTLRAAEVGLQVPTSTRLLIYPSVSSYVGGDIVAGVLASGMYMRPELTLFIDIGTNGEIVVGNQDWMTCAACSAGPAFEGGGVKFGMRAAPGAVDQFYFDPVARRHGLTVIGEPWAKPIGICGSGLISIVSELFLSGVLDPQGKFVPEAAPDFIRDGEDGREYLLKPQAETGLDRDLTITEIDVENLIRAKGAMYSGYQTLLESVGLTMNDLERVIIAGGFGKSLNLTNAMAIGLLPELPVEKFTYIGNSSLTGATLVTLSGGLWQKAQKIKDGLTNFELSETPGYMDYYMASQFLPHTQSDLFPRTMDRRKKKLVKLH